MLNQHTAYRAYIWLRRQRILIHKSPQRKYPALAVRGGATKISEIICRGLPAQERAGNSVFRGTVIIHHSSGVTSLLSVSRRRFRVSFSSSVREKSFPDRKTIEAIVMRTIRTSIRCPPFFLRYQLLVSLGSREHLAQPRGVLKRWLRHHLRLVYIIARLWIKVNTSCAFYYS